MKSTYSNTNEIGALVCRHYSAWTVIQNGGIIADRSAQKITINRMLFPKFPQYIFHHFCRLNEFKMTHQRLKRIEGDSFNAPVVPSKINLSHNEIELIDPSSFGERCNNLVTLDLSFNRIEFIDDLVFNLARFPELKQLYLHHNRLTAIQWDQFNDLLFDLWLNDNDITSITSDTPLSISYIDLSNNRLGNSSHPLRVMADRIKLRNASIHDLIIYPVSQEVMAQLNHISRIGLGDDDIHMEFRLTSLNLSNNEIVSIAEFSRLTNLKDVDLSYNRLDTLDGNVFSKMNRLVRIDISHNNLKSIDFGFLLNTISLGYLDVSYNNLRFFRLNGISPSLGELYIEGNNLTELDTNMKRMARNLVKLGLDDNNWHCGYLKSALPLIEIDDIVPVARGGAGYLGYNYTGEVEGIRCFSEFAHELGSTTTEYFVEENTSEKAATHGDIEKLIDSKLDRLETKLIQLFDEKFEKSFQEWGRKLFLELQLNNHLVSQDKTPVYIANRED